MSERNHLDHCKPHQLDVDEVDEDESFDETYEDSNRLEQFGTWELNIDAIPLVDEIDVISSVDEIRITSSMNIYPPSDMKCLQYQRKLFREYYDVTKLTPPFLVRTKTEVLGEIQNKMQNVKASWECYVRIFDFTRSKQLSQSDGDDMLKLFRDISNHYGLVIPLPSTLEAIENACMKNVQKSGLQDMEESVFRLPAMMFVPKSINITLKPVKSVRLRLLDRICHSLLEGDPDMFADRPYPQPNPRNHQYSYFSSGKLFKSLYDSTLGKFGPEAVPLCIAISLDSSTINSSRNRSECPVLFSILNFNSTASYSLIGYAPTTLPYSDAEISCAMSKCNFVPSRQKKLIPYLKRKIKLAYLDDILRPLLELATTGFAALIGTGPKAKSCVLVPYLCMIVGDSEELGRLSGQRGKVGCRLCTSTNIHIYDPEMLGRHVLRSDVESDRIISAGEDLFLCQTAFTRNAHDPEHIPNYRKSVAETLAEIELTNSGLHPGRNPLYKYFEFQNSLGVNSFHQAVVPDHLHTVQLGIIQYCIDWTVQIAFAVRFLDPTRFALNIGVIDSRIINMDALYSYEFLPTVHFRCVRA